MSIRIYIVMVFLFLYNKEEKVAYGRNNLIAFIPGFNKGGGTVIQLDRRQQLIILLLVGVILFSGGYRLAQIKDKSPEKLMPALESAEAL